MKAFKSVLLAMAVCLAPCAAFAQAPTFNTTGLVVTTCGTIPTPFIAGRAGPITIEAATGKLCDGSGGGGGGDATAANQVLQIAQETAINTILGLQADVACSTDNGTCTIAALSKRGNQRLTTINTTLGTPFQAGGSIGNTTFASTVADGANVVEGAVADAASTQGGTGTLSAKLRLMTTQFNTLNTTVATSANQTTMSGNQTAVQIPVPAGGATATKGNLVGGEYRSTLPGPLTNGQQAPLQVGTRGSVDVTLFGQDSVTAATIKAASTAAANTDQPLVIDVVPRAQLTTGTAGTPSAQVVSVQGVASGTPIPIQTSDPCNSANKSSAAINVTSGTTTSLVAVSAVTTVYVCGFSITIAPSAVTAATALFEYGTGASCTSPTALTGTYGNGDLTSAAGVAPILYGNGGATIFKSAASSGICILTAGNAVSVQGVLTYVQQ